MRTFGALRSMPGDRWAITKAEPHVVMRLKRMFPKVADFATLPIVMNGGDDMSADLLWFMQRYPLSIDPEDRAKLEAARKRVDQLQAEIDSILLPSWQANTLDAFRPDRPPYPYQSRAAEIAHLRGNLLLLDDVGLGKTVSALAAVARPGRLPAAIAVQAHLASQWVKEYIGKFTTLTAHIIKAKTPYSLPPADIYIFKYSNIAGWADVASRGVFKSVVYDEIQELRRGSDTQKGSAAEVFTRSTGMAIGLTATPIYNYGSEIFRVGQFVAPGALGSHEEFCREWCHKKGDHWIVTKAPAPRTARRPPS